MTLEDKITHFLHCEWEAGDEVKRASLFKASAYLENIWETIAENPDEGYTVDGLIKAGLVTHVDAEADDEDLTDALEAIIKAHGE